MTRSQVSRSGLRYLLTQCWRRLTRRLCLFDIDDSGLDEAISEAGAEAIQFLTERAMGREDACDPYRDDDYTI